MSLRLGFLPGVHGQELVDAGLACEVLHACGATLRRIHEIVPERLPAGVHAGRPGVLVHGGYGPNNVLLDQRASEVAAVRVWQHRLAVTGSWTEQAASP